MSTRVTNYLTRGEALRRIPAPELGSRIVSQVQNVRDIAALLLVAEKNSRHYAAGIAGKLLGENDLETLENIWYFARTNIHYVKEPGEKQTARTINRVLYDGWGDCKHLSTICVGLARALGIPVKFRLVSFNKYTKIPSHVYAVATLDGREIIMDAVLNTFNTAPQHIGHIDVKLLS